MQLVVSFHRKLKKWGLLTDVGVGLKESNQGRELGKKGREIED